jgi:hypothetical protein
LFVEQAHRLPVLIERQAVRLAYNGYFPQLQMPPASR